MHSQTVNTVGPDRRTAGPVSLAQGVYGARGNLELIACDVADGLWVFWFNADSPEDPCDTPDVPPGRWSAGLLFATGHRYVDARILQSALGPDHLEVVALTDDGVLESWYWSPGPGFQRRADEVSASVRRFRLAQEEGTLVVSVEHVDGSAEVLSAGPDDYPGRTWRVAERRPDLDDDRAADTLRALGVAEVEEGTARGVRSTREGGTTELTWRDSRGRIRHLGIPAS